MTDEGPITYDDIVVVAREAPERFQPGACGSVFSVYVAQTDAYASAHGVPIGTTMIGIELPDGSSFEVPVQFLSRRSLDNESAD